MHAMNALLTTKLQATIATLRSGGVIAYPTESCFGLGCDPHNTNAIKQLLTIKHRSPTKGLILIAASIKQAQKYVYTGGTLSNDILGSWPGPHTWLLPPKKNTRQLLRGNSPLLAIRVTAHPTAKRICELFGGAIVSTSANLTGKPMLTTAKLVQRHFGRRLDSIVALPIGNDTMPSQIHHGLTGKILRK